MGNAIIIRDAIIDDSEELAVLAGQLGYPCTGNEVKERIIPYLDNPNSRIIVAETENKVVGWISLDIVEHVYQEKYIGLSGLVIDEKYRGLGIGSEIIKETILWAKKKGINSIRLNANIKRKAAHRFYENNGFKRIKEQYVFVNEVTIS